ncbi:MAG: MoxR family ATPase [Alphaproteobacteria bacterium]|nr:MoxR family ATPase [Alphaproteobacteria bacterium]MCB9927986.1 MoxR family ATPase [Alphaproteobacteria bacterium]
MTDLAATRAEKLQSIERIQQGYAELGYICSRTIATALYVACHLEKPILIEGPAGVGKTELANTTSAYLEAPLIRLQCYEGLDEGKALYEWRYAKQLLYTQILKDKMEEVLQGAKGLAESMDQLHRHSDVFFSERFLAPRPLLQALREDDGCVLLIDEVDKSDHEFEAFLLEILSEFQITIPELGTIKAKKRPYVFLTSNNTRDMSDALKRRCLHLFVPFPDAKLEREIIRARVPDIPPALRTQLVHFVQSVREMDLKKQPSVSETIDWARVLLLLHANELDADMVRETLNVFLKFEEDIQAVDQHLYEFIRSAEKAVA